MPVEAMTIEEHGVIVKAAAAGARRHVRASAEAEDTARVATFPRVQDDAATAANYHAHLVAIYAYRATVGVEHAMDLAIEHNDESMKKLANEYKLDAWQAQEDANRASGKAGNAAYYCYPRQQHEGGDIWQPMKSAGPQRIATADTFPERSLADHIPPVLVASYAGHRFKIANGVSRYDGKDDYPLVSPDEAGDIHERLYHGECDLCGDPITLGVSEDNQITAYGVGEHCTGLHYDYRKETD